MSVGGRLNPKSLLADNVATPLISVRRIKERGHRPAANYVFCFYRCYSNQKVVDMQKSLAAQFTPMRTTAADSRTKIFITLDT
jgi:hypothetical protein